MNKHDWHSEQFFSRPLQPPKPVVSDSHIAANKGHIIQLSLHHGKMFKSLRQTQRDRQQLETHIIASKVERKKIGKNV